MACCMEYRWNGWAGFRRSRCPCARTTQGLGFRVAVKAKKDRFFASAPAAISATNTSSADIPAVAEIVYLRGAALLSVLRPPRPGMSGPRRR